MGRNKTADGIQIITHREPAEPISLSPDKLDTEVLSAYFHISRFQFYKENKAEIEQAISDRLITLCAEVSRKENCPQHISTFLELHLLRAEGKKSSEKVPMPQTLPVATSLSALTGLSVNEIIFGIPRKVELKGRAAGFLELYAQLSSEQQKEILAELKNGEEPATNPYYIFQQRGHEAILLENKAHIYNRLSMASAWDNKRWKVLFSERFDPVTAEASDRRLGYGQAWYFLIYMLASELNRSADYLFVQDYSDLATLHGADLTPDQKQILSIYLKAAPAVQELVICKIAAYLVDKLKRNRYNKNT